MVAFIGLLSFLFFIAFFIAGLISYFTAKTNANKYAKYSCISFILFILTIIMSGGSKNNSASVTAATSMTLIEVSAGQLFDEYKANEVAADDKYKGKTIKVTGIIDEISKDFADNAIVKLKTSNQFSTVFSYLEKSELEKAKNLSKDIPITMVCNGQGMIITSAILKECVIP